MEILKEFTDFAVNSGWCVDGESTQNGFLFYNAQTNDRWIGWQAAQASSVPEGFVLVPKEPIFEMIVAGKKTGITIGEAKSCYQAMIEAQEQSHD